MQRRLGDLRTGYQVAPATATAAAATQLHQLRNTLRRERANNVKQNNNKNFYYVKKEQQLARTVFIDIYV